MSAITLYFNAARVHEIQTLLCRQGEDANECCKRIIEEEIANAKLKSDLKR